MGSGLYRKYPYLRKGHRKRNYEKGRFGRRTVHTKFSWWERILIMVHIIPDRWVARWLDSSVNGVQALRWRIKVNYLGLYGK